MEAPAAGTSPGRVIYWDRLLRQLGPLTLVLLLNCYNLYYGARFRRRHVDALRIYLWSIAGCALLFLLVLLVRALKRRAILAGPAVGGVVKSTNVREDQSSLRPRFFLRITYKFYVKDEPYWASERRSFRDASEAEAAAARWLDREVTIHYHPRNPDRSLLAVSPEMPARTPA